MQGLRRFPVHPVPALLVVWAVSLAGQCVAQEIEVPSGPHDPGTVFAPTGYLELIVPPKKRVGLRLYGFYAGEIEAPAAQLDVPIQATKYLTITPSYLYFEVPASGLNTVASKQPARFTQSYEENQFRIDGNLKFSIHKFEISERNMYVRRFRPTDEINRYRNRIGFAYPLTVQRRVWKPFAYYEANYEWRNGGWNKNRVWSGVTVPLQKHVSFQPSYIYESSRKIKDIHYLIFALIYTTK